MNRPPAPAPPAPPKSGVRKAPPPPNPKVKKGPIRLTITPEEEEQFRIIREKQQQQQREKQRQLQAQAQKGKNGQVNKQQQKIQQLNKSIPKQQQMPALPQAKKQISSQQISLTTKPVSSIPQQQENQPQSQPQPQVEQPRKVLPPPAIKKVVPAGRPGPGSKKPPPPPTSLNRSIISQGNNLQNRTEEADKIQLKNPILNPSRSTSQQQNLQLPQSLIVPPNTPTTPYQSSQEHKQNLVTPQKNDKQQKQMEIQEKISNQRVPLPATNVAARRPKVSQMPKIPAVKVPIKNNLNQQKQSQLQLQSNPKQFPETQMKQQQKQRSKQQPASASIPIQTPKAQKISSPPQLMVSKKSSTSQIYQSHLTPKYSLLHDKLKDFSIRREKLLESSDEDQVRSEIGSQTYSEMDRHAKVGKNRDDFGDRYVHTAQSVKIPNIKTKNQFQIQQKPKNSQPQLEPQTQQQQKQKQKQNQPTQLQQQSQPKFVSELKPEPQETVPQPFSQSQPEQTQPAPVRLPPQPTTKNTKKQHRPIPAPIPIFKNKKPQQMKEQLKETNALPIVSNPFGQQQINGNKQQQITLSKSQENLAKNQSASLLNNNMLQQEQIIDQQNISKTKIEEAPQKQQNTYEKQQPQQSPQPSQPISQSPFPSSPKHAPIPPIPTHAQAHLHNPSHPIPPAPSHLHLHKLSKQSLSFPTLESFNSLMMDFNAKKEQYLKNAQQLSTLCAQFKKQESVKMYQINQLLGKLDQINVVVEGLMQTY